jgi:deoxyribodipyrimidine photolyase-related protein
MDCTLIFPHQLFRHHPALAAGRPVILPEEWLFFRQYRFHRQKIVLHRASMQAYAHLLREKGWDPWYIDSQSPIADIRLLVPELKRQGYTSIHIAETADDWLERRLRISAGVAGIQVHTYPSPGFLNDLPALQAYAAGKDSFFQTDFYIAQRKSRAILLEPGNKPVGGKWTFDTDNRKKMPKGHRPPLIAFPEPDAYIREAITYTETHFHGHYGDAQPPLHGRFPWAWTHAGASALLDDFLANRLAAFGDYEDAMSVPEHFLYHSVLTPMLNIGLLEPAQVLDATLSYADRHPVPLNALEGFIRQVAGWREFIRMVYAFRGGYQRTRNYWGFKRRIPQQFWTGSTGIGPVDAVIRKVLDTGYSHHIERLMILGNFFLLCEFDPNDVYRWFMEMYVDAYDWVMVPNVYGMTQFADGGLMTTKPYISGSNYLRKMGDWETTVVPATGATWQETWDGLFWRFMDKHRDFFGQNPRLGMLLGTFDKMPGEKRQQHLAKADAYLQWLDHAQD